MHQNSANGVAAQTPLLVASAVDALGEPDVVGITSLVGEKCPLRISPSSTFAFKNL